MASSVADIQHRLQRLTSEEDIRKGLVDLFPMIRQAVEQALSSSGHSFTRLIRDMRNDALAIHSDLSSAYDRDVFADLLVTPGAGSSAPYSAKWWPEHLLLMIAAAQNKKTPLGPTVELRPLVLHKRASAALDKLREQWSPSQWKQRLLQALSHLDHAGADHGPRLEGDTLVGRGGAVKLAPTQCELVSKLTNASGPLQRQAAGYPTQEAYRAAVSRLNTRLTKAQCPWTVKVSGGGYQLVDRAAP